MSNLSKREKLMLYVMALVIIVAGGVKFLMLPLMDRYQTVQEELFVQELQQQEMAGAMNSAEVLQEEIRQAKADIAAQQAKLYPYMMPDEVDHMLTSMLLNYSLTPLSLSLSDPAMIPAVPYGTVPAEGQTQEEAAAAAAYAGLPGYQAYLTAWGSLDNLARLTDGAAANPALKIDNFTSRWDQTAGAYKIDMELLVYMNDYGE